MSDRQCRKERFKICDVASIKVEDDGEPHTVNLCLTYYNFSEEERKETAKSDRRWEIRVGRQELPRQTVGWLGRKRIRKHDVGVLRSPKRCLRKVSWRTRHGIETEQQLDRGVGH